MRVLMMGPPGSGKGTQAITLAEALDAPHISTGDLFRAHVRDQTELGKIVQLHLDQGSYVPDELTNEMVRERLARPDAQTSFVLDGYPRTVEQVAELDHLLAADGAGLDVVVELTVDRDELIQRLLARARLSGRTDDTAEVIESRLNLYSRETAPLIEVYEQRDLLRRIDGVGDIVEISGRLQAALLEVHVSAV
ncbi:adenylate kinase [Aeromicrobium wangtongii]|uniref:Adenylate kinase n=1 Tax=Aeromicrobium wangtongii TaxID=2969247 RepID=A0ABY5MDX2_9ACTN|nr:adenylate kinase [Aeromicrobium wangtongii]MCD9197913.1 adenylate kinase [Aeromicrobium wangtongii]UUP15391.1 adenylate kinase [Aeromicrobium wangtongii]